MTTDERPPACTICPVRPPRPALTASGACKPCVAELEAILADLDRLLPQLRSMLAERASSDTAGRAGAGAVPLRIGVLSLLDERATDSPGKVLARWAGTFGTHATPQALRQAIGRIVEHPELRAFARDLRALHKELIRVCGEPGTQARRVATCQQQRHGRPCGGAIIAAPRGDEAVCAKCRDTWPRERWGLLARMQPTGRATLGT